MKSLILALLTFFITVNGNDNVNNENTESDGPAGFMLLFFGLAFGVMMFSINENNNNLKKKNDLYSSSSNNPSSGSGYSSRGSATHNIGPAGICVDCCLCNC